MSTLSTLEEVVERHGRATLADPTALAGALRSLPAPPSDAEIAALAEVAGSGAVERMRAVREQGGSPEEARAAAVIAVTGTVGGLAGWACDQLGQALGLLPREPEAETATTVLGDGPTTILTRTDVPASGSTPRRRPLLITTFAVLVAVMMGAGVALVVDTSENTKTGEPAPVTALPASPPSGAVPGSVSTPPTSSNPAAGPADPRSAFTDPELLKAAEPYLSRPGVSCEAGQPSRGVQESVACDLGEGLYLGLFQKLLNPSQLDALRSVWINDNPDALAGSVRVLRWDYVPGSPGLRRGIPGVTAGQGAGTRIRWLTNGQYARMYFDEDATGVGVLLQAMTNDQQLLRSFWADPDS